MSTAEAVFSEMTKVKPWTSKDFQRFWATTKRLDYSKDYVHLEIFGIESMKDFNGTVDDAIAILETYDDVPIEPEPADDFPPDDPTYYPEPPHIENTVSPLRTWTEAPASVTIRAYAPNGFDVMLTIRDDDTAALIERMTGALGWLANKGYKPVYGNGNGGTNGRKPQSAAPQAQATNGDAPVCNLHNKPMKRSQHFAGWYCTAKLADDTYCKEQVED